MLSDASRPVVEATLPAVGANIGEIAQRFYRHMFGAHPELLDEWLAVIPGDRVDVLNLSTIHPSAPTEAVSLVVEGYEQTIGPSTWTVIMNTSLASRWAVASVAAQTIGGSALIERPCARKPDAANSAMKKKPSARCVP